MMNDDDLALPGLIDAVSISVDPWGIPHIRASNLTDLFFAQGFNAARDRLWQMDLWRKRGLGLLAADFGPGYLEQDRASRLFLYRGAMAAEWACYSPDAQDICEAFVRGINAYVDLAAADPERMPVEFIKLGTRPAHWMAEDVVRIRGHALMRNAISEVTRANVMAGARAGTGEEPAAWFAAPAKIARDRLLLETLARAYGECSERMGADPSSWAWGRLHQAYFEHALTGVKQDRALDVGPWPLGGSESTPMNATYRFDDFRVVTGASFRVVVDVGDWNRSVCINAPGQSGDPRSPHYGDLAERWSRGEYVPLLYTQGSVDAATEQRIMLRPAGSPALPRK